jgi:hypothetical protein
MAISDSAKVDLLYKKAFGVAKTDLPANKSPSNESIASPALLRGDNVWQQASSIPTTAAATSGIVQAYVNSTSVKCIADTTSTPIGGVYPSWKTNLSDWIPSEFGATYFVKVYADASNASDPSSTGTQIFDSGSAGVGEWNFDYQSGVLNFIGGTIPTTLTSSKVIYISGYRYIGSKGVSSFPNGLTIGNIDISGNTISSNIGITFGSNVTGTNGNFTNIISNNLYGNVQTSAQPYITSLGTLTGLDVNGNITTGNISSGVFYGNAVGTNANYSGNVEVGNLSIVGTTVLTTLIVNTVEVDRGDLTAANTYSTFYGNSYGTTATYTGNVLAGIVNATTLYGNLIGSVSGNVSGNISGANGNFSSNVTAANLVTGSVYGNIITAVQPYITTLGTLTNLSVAGNVTASNITATTNFYGNIYGNVLTPTQPYITALGNVGNLRVVGNVSSTNTISTTFYGNLVGNTAGVHTGDVVGTVLTADQPYITTVGNLGNLVVNSNISSTNTISTTFYGNLHADRITPLLTTVTEFDSIGAIGLPNGSTIQRPGLSKGGYLRYNTDIPSIEYYNGTTWVPVTNVVRSQIISPDGTSQSYQLNQLATEAGVIVSINGTVQQPGTAYSIHDTTITFSEIPQITDIVDVRFLGATVTINTSLADNLEVAGNLSVSGPSATVNNLTANVFSIGNFTFKDTNNKLIISCGNVNVFAIDSDGNVTISGNISYGQIV